MICIEKKIRHLSKKYVFTTRGGFGISRHNLHERKRLGVGREMGTDCLAHCTGRSVWWEGEDTVMR